MLVTLPGIVTLVRLLQYVNAYPPIPVTPSSMTTASICEVLSYHGALAEV